MEIASTARDCLIKFKTLLDQASGNSREIEDEYGRFRVWVGNISAHRTGRRSLEYRLRDSSNLQATVTSLLKDLQALLERLQGLATQKQLRDGAHDGDSPALETTTDSELVEDDDADLFGLDEEDSSPNALFDQVLDEAHEVVTCLLRFSMTLRNPARHDQLKQAAVTTTKHFEPHDINHVREKFQNAPGFLHRRLGKAISKHRQYFKYREEHHQKLAEDLDGAPDGLGERPSTIATSVNASDKALPAVSTAADETESVYTATSFAPTTTGNTALKPPPMPEAGHNGEPFQCPLCYLIIVAEDQRSWRQHVYEDLPPYVCTFESCVSADHKYSRRRDWQRHYAEYHNRHWLCPFGCASEIASESDFFKHLAKAHSQSLDTASAQRMSAACTVAHEPSDLTCPLCKDTLPTAKRLYKHLGHHLEQFALHALPQHVLGSDSDDENAEIVDDSDVEEDYMNLHKTIDIPDELLGAEFRSELEELDEPARQHVSSYWSVPEQDDFIKFIGHFGRDFAAIAAHMGTKTQTMLKNHYQRQIDGGSPELEQSAVRAEERRVRGEDIGPPPVPTPIVKREYDRPQPQQEQSAMHAEERRMRGGDLGSDARVPVEVEGPAGSPFEHGMFEEQKATLARPNEWRTDDEVESRGSIQGDIVDGFKRGKTRMPRRLVRLQAITDLGYPYDEEDDFFVLKIALEKEQIDEIVQVSESYKSGEKMVQEDQDEDEDVPRGWSSQGRDWAFVKETRAQGSGGDAQLQPETPEEVLDGSPQTSAAGVASTVRNSGRTEEPGNEPLASLVESPDNQRSVKAAASATGSTVLESLPACQRCREMKSRCDTSSPCGSCSKNNSECIRLLIREGNDPKSDPIRESTVPGIQARPLRQGEQTRVHQSLVSEGTLVYFDIPYKADATDPGWYIIDRYLSTTTFDHLKEHSKRLRKATKTSVDVTGSRADDSETISAQQEGTLPRPLPEKPQLARQWFIPGDGIEREVISAEISHDLGSDATVRPGHGVGSDEGIAGYWIKAYRNLTSSMIAEWRAKSQRWREWQELGRAAIGTKVVRSPSVDIEQQQSLVPTSSFSKNMDVDFTASGSWLQKTSDPKALATHVDADGATHASVYAASVPPTKTDDPLTTEKTSKSRPKSKNAVAEDITSKSVHFAQSSSAGVSRPLNNTEAWSVWHFEDHAQNCHSCYPDKVFIESGQLCSTGTALAQDLAAHLVYSGGEFYSRHEEGGKRVRIKIDAGHAYVRDVFERKTYHLGSAPRAVQERSAPASAARPVVVVESRPSFEHGDSTGSGTAERVRPRYSTTRDNSKGEAVIVEPADSKNRDKPSSGRQGYRTWRAEIVQDGEMQRAEPPNERRGSLYEADATRRTRDKGYRIEVHEPRDSEARRLRRRERRDDFYA